MSEFLSRFPELRLEQSDPQAPKLVAELGPAHELYAFAAWMYHHADELEEAQRKALFVALERAWPRQPGRPPTRRGKRLVVSLLKESGIPTKRIASKLMLSASNVDNLYRETKRFREDASWKRRAPRIARASPDDLRVPYDPQSWLGEQFARGADALSPGFTYDLDQAEELAAEEGFSSLDELSRDAFDS